MEIPQPLMLTYAESNGANHKCISDFKVIARPADVGKDAFSQRDPSFTDNKLPNPLCMPGGKFCGDKGNKPKDGRVTLASRGGKGNVAEERMPLG